MDIRPQRVIGETVFDGTALAEIRWPQHRPRDRLTGRDSDAASVGGAHDREPVQHAPQDLGFWAVC